MYILARSEGIDMATMKQMKQMKQISFLTNDIRTNPMKSNVDRLLYTYTLYSSCSATPSVQYMLMR